MIVEGVDSMMVFDGGGILCEPERSRNSSATGMNLVPSLGAHVVVAGFGCTSS